MRLFYKKLGTNLKTIRRGKKIRQHALAKKVKLVQSALCRMEKGTQKMKVHQLYLFSKALNVPVDTILRGGK
jgi:transcriptional regulator with XRE-family HTH domain